MGNAKQHSLPPPRRKPNQARKTPPIAFVMGGNANLFAAYRAPLDLTRLTIESRWRHQQLTLFAATDPNHLYILVDPDLEDAAWALGHDPEDLYHRLYDDFVASCSKNTEHAQQLQAAKKPSSISRHVSCFTAFEKKSLITADDQFGRIMDYRPDKTEKYYISDAAHQDLQQYLARQVVLHELAHTVQHQVILTPLASINHANPIYQTYLQEVFADMLSLLILRRQGAPETALDNLIAFRALESINHATSIHTAFNQSAGQPPAANKEAEINGELIYFIADALQAGLEQDRQRNPKPDPAVNLPLLLDEAAAYVRHYARNHRQFASQQRRWLQSTILPNGTYEKQHRHIAATAQRHDKPASPAATTRSGDFNRIKRAELLWLRGLRDADPHSVWRAKDILRQSNPGPERDELIDCYQLHQGALELSAKNITMDYIASLRVAASTEIRKMIATNPAHTAPSNISHYIQTATQQLQIAAQLATPRQDARQLLDAICRIESQLQGMAAQLQADPLFCRQLPQDHEIFDNIHARADRLHPQWLDRLAMEILLAKPCKYDYPLPKIIATELESLTIKTPQRALPAAPIRPALMPRLA